MSLIKQIWLTILVLLLLAFGGSLFIGVSSSRHYIEQEVEIKNTDNANALALSMTQLDKDPVNMSLLLAAQFDTGHYRLIELRSPEGEIIERREAETHIDDVPAWFVNLVRFDVAPGQAVIQDGWRQYGTLHLQSQHSFAYRSLWRSTLELAGWFAVAGLLSLALAAWIVRTIKRPLSAVVEQARDIGVRRFTVSDEPRTLELREVVQAMNQLSTSVRDMLANESERLDQLRRRLQHDAVTGVLNRDAFMGQLRITLERGDQRASGTLALVRLSRLGEVSATLGHHQTNALLKALAGQLEVLGDNHGDGVVGRLGGGDFAVLVPGHVEPAALADELAAMLATLKASETHVSLGLPSAFIAYSQGDRVGALMSSLDGTLAAAEEQGDLVSLIAEGSARLALFNTHAEWRTALQEAMQTGVYLGHFPVLDREHHLLHLECPSRLRLKNEWRPAGVFMPWISRLELNEELDMAVARASLKEIARHGKPLGINLSASSVRSARFVLDFRALLESQRELANQLWVELPESVALHDLENFRSLCRELQPFGCKLGLEHVGREFRRISDLQDLGLAYLKFDASLVKGVDNSPEQQTILRGMATLSHSVGILAIAEGVDTLKEREVLVELGLDGVTGPGIRQHDRPG
ncbi:EAL domain-containing protein [Halomonas urumqiensis]|uniref:Diguanylate phosphodiesterase, EAL domain protein n=1 Tax=Halomonas urumqiensis TaxID=1684789 RepID=A0A2N7ULN0_9GAMM|nr:EAL domain-containing protein [Halomonas urumqiensis]PMR81335.1 Diguanylate phosphodiesterase, EAL domain protein [Halomonas urumqiensis]PTB01136.1 HAMP domain-containing protein [Halomonas urumqiensis]GHE22702.1 GGDEF domain-containing protein [Halomonas urumqiensis]